MEKISKVIPSTTKGKIDMSKERPMRSGAPNYGAPVAHSAVTLRKMEEAKRLQALEDERRAQMSPQELRQSDIVDTVTLSFRKKEPEVFQNENSPSTMDLVVTIESPAERSHVEADGPSEISLYA